MTTLRSIKTPNRILVRGVNWLGDLVMSLPALTRLHERFHESEIILQVHEKLEGLVRGQPWLSKTLAFRSADSLWRSSRRLREGRYDLALVFPNSTRSALESKLAGVPCRVGYAGRGRSWLLTHSVARPETQRPMRKRTVREIESLIQRERPKPPPAFPASAHHIHHYLHLTSQLGCEPEPLPPRLHVSESQASEAREKFGFPKDRRCLGINAGAEYGWAKRWPEERFIETAARAARETGCAVVLLGGPADVETARRIHSALESLAAPPASLINLAGRTSLAELPAVLSFCRAVLTNDSGPMHVAAAVGTRVVVPFGSTSPELTGPGLPGDPRHALLKTGVACAPCFLRTCPIDQRCMTSISTEAAVRATLKALEDD